MLESPEDFSSMVEGAKYYQQSLENAASNLHKEMGTNYFALCRLRGKYLFSPCLATNMHFGEDWFRLGRTLIAPPTNGFFLASQLRDFYSEKLIESLKDTYGIDNLLFYVEHRKNYTDIYSFASEPDRPDVINNYINKGSRQILNLIPSFRESFKNIINDLEKEIAFIYIQDEPVYQAPYQLTEKRTAYSGHKYSSERIKQFEKDLKLLPDRIYDTLLLTAVGLTAKEAARELKVVPKTVEGHIENAKLRLGVDGPDGKQRLMDLFLLVAF